MKHNLQDLAIYLSSLYMGIPVSKNAIEHLQNYVYDMESSRFEIMQNIDNILKKYQDDPAQGKISAIEMSPLDNGQYAIKFMTDTTIHKNITPDQTTEQKLQSILKAFGTGAAPASEAKPMEFNFGDIPDEQDGEQTIFDELSIIKSAIDLIKSIEEHSQTRPTALGKYIAAIEKIYLAPYLSLE